MAVSAREGGKVEALAGSGRTTDGGTGASDMTRLTGKPGARVRECRPYYRRHRTVATYCQAIRGTLGCDRIWQRHVADPAALYRRLAARRGRKRALVALGNTLLGMVY